MRKRGLLFLVSTLAAGAASAAPYGYGGNQQIGPYVEYYKWEIPQTKKEYLLLHRQRGAKPRSGRPAPGYDRGCNRVYSYVDLKQGERESVWVLQQGNFKTANNPIVTIFKEEDGRLVEEGGIRSRQSERGLPSRRREDCSRTRRCKANAADVERERSVELR